MASLQELLASLRGETPENLGRNLQISLAIDPNFHYTEMAEARTRTSALKLKEEPG